MTAEVKSLIEAREKTHGPFRATAQKAQELKAAFRSSPNWGNFSDVQKEALEMRASKIARYLCGNPNDPDHLADDQGYDWLFHNG